MWSLRLTEAQRTALIELLAEQEDGDEVLAAALEEIEYARWDDLPDAELPWERVEDLASRQGISEADVVWDLCGGLGAPVRSSASGVSGRRRSPARAGGRRPR